MSTSAELARTFEALSHPARIEVVRQLRAGPVRASDLATALSLSAPSASRHLKVLREAGLVEEHGDPSDARVRRYALRHDPFADLRGWLDEVEAFWTDQLLAFRAHVEGDHR